MSAPEDLYDEIQRGLNAAIAESIEDDVAKYVTGSGTGRPQGIATVTKVAGQQVISRELARLSGLVESTAEELAADERHRAEWGTRAAAAEKVLAAARVRLGAIQSDGPLRAVLDLHSEDEQFGAPTCSHCVSGEAGDHDPWPCQTIRVVAAACGIELPA